MIDYTIHACIEYEELKGLIYYLKNFLQFGDKIIVVLDKNNTNNTMIDMVKVSKVEYHLHPLTTFSDTARYIRSLCNNSTIFHLCADEVPTIPLIQHSRTIFQSNTECDSIGIPRINLYSNLTKAKALNMYTGDRPQDFLLQEPKNEYGWHVWPDYQVRITRNVDYIQYGPELHSGFVGLKNTAFFPADPQFALLHVKSVEHQERMLKVYDDK